MDDDVTRSSEETTGAAASLAADDVWTEGVRVRGARQNNLKDVALDLPRDAIVVFTGVSGSGKSSLAFGTLFAESQRRYLESVAPYARRLIDQAGVPDVDVVEGMPPAVALQQQRGGGGARSDVATMTTVSSVVHMLYSRAGCYPDGQHMLYAEDFSPNTVAGACPRCHGIGRVYEVTEDAMVPDPTRSIRDRAIASWPPAWQGQNLRDILVSRGVDVDVPWQDLPQEQRDFILYTEERPTEPVYAGMTPAQTRRTREQGLEASYRGTFVGARRYVLDTFASTKSALVKRRVSQFVTSAPCPECGGRRLKAESLSVTFEGLDIGEFTALPLARLAEVVAGVLEPGWAPTVETDVAAGEVDAAHTDTTDADPADVEVSEDAHADTAEGTHGIDPAEGDLGGAAADAPAGSSHGAGTPPAPPGPAERRLAAQRLARDLLARLQPMIDLGLGYLSLDRTTPTLSGGEKQRLRLATQLSSKLFGVVYVLDEPSAGLHPRDLDALLRILHGLKRRGNSVFVVEHSLPVIAEADWLVDLGPGAGEHGGRVLYSGEPAGIAHVEESVTRRYLVDTSARTVREPRRPAGRLRLEGVVRNNLDGLDVELPVGCLTAVTGISGSGKSSLVSQALPALVRAHLGQGPGEADVDGDPEDLLLTGDQGSVRGRVTSGSPAVRRVVTIDQKPIGRTPRSNVATYTGLFDGVRKLFAATDEARRRRYGAGRFSFNVAAGRCPTCEGEGSVMVELLFLPSVYAPCPDCHGTRYKDSTLEITWHGRTIADVLAMSVEEAHAFFAGEDDVHHSLGVLRDVGLGYLRLGQPATELSGGEAQRVKLATELQRGRRGDTLYVLDEPTAGLHPADSDRLVHHLHGLVDAGNTVVMAELDMRIVAEADHVVDLGPGAGGEGGRIVAAGSPDEVARSADSVTAPYLAAALH
ncbi:excinuclease ABC subunit UvrA [Mobilicoccus pelagius]|uniref:UvrABC system protein A n=1 Tax=Mobilicoccus pelagius NBRC 104925 TaxID=1089455 RepID=H5UQQ1_9MICO|nr:excinuclease ABC subunit UvrA [Mobilicoccus pelagius]GAB48059.1 putative UvrA-like protein [Mobilicoccus pelagius NBRC 104925]